MGILVLTAAWGLDSIIFAAASII
uniref:Uncharacterized protein n=1 Tax=Rhizophora mucronata TaxID=61149 RepID=A0A2P2NVD3_RHIMU